MRKKISEFEEYKNMYKDVGVVVIWKEDIISMKRSKVYRQNINAMQFFYFFCDTSTFKKPISFVFLSLFETWLVFIFHTKCARALLIDLATFKYLEPTHAISEYQTISIPI